MVLAALALLFAAPMTLNDPPPPYPTAAVAADHLIASRAGAEVMREGGNAVDAAVAASFALSVVRPYSCGIGGGGFMVIALREDPRAPGSGPVRVALDYRDAAPAWVGPGTFVGDPDPEAERRGGRSVCVPGTVAGLLAAQERYGLLPRSAVLAPAIRAAEEGFDADEHYVSSVGEDVLPWLAARPGSRERFAFLWSRFLKEGLVRVGDRVRLPEQARALRLIAEHGRDGFYSGPVAEAMVRAANADGARLTLEDLASYRVIEREPLSSEFRGLTVLGMPPPSSGGLAVAQTLEILERRPELARDGHNATAYAHALTEAFKHAFADRARWGGDPAFADVPVRRLLDPAYLDDLARRFDPARTLSSDRYGTGPAPAGPEDGGTAHVCAVDRWGNAVACTETINLIFGSFVAAEPFGFILNDSMDDFTARPGRPNEFGLVQSEANDIRPGKRPLSSMSPTIVLDEGGTVRVVAGAAGGPRIITSTVQATLNVLLFDMGALPALSAPRLHHQWSPDRVQLEPGLFGTGLREGLAALGHEVAERKAVGNTQIIRAAPGGGWDAAADPRKGGLPAGF